jgi:hypothetical protein
MEINKEEFFKEFNLGDINGLDNLGKQLDILFNDICEKEKVVVEKWNNTKDIIKKNELDRYIKMYELKQQKICRAKAVLELTEQANYIYVETQMNKYAEKFFINAENLYNQMLSDLLDIVGITNKDFEKYAN